MQGEPLIEAGVEWVSGGKYWATPARMLQVGTQRGETRRFYEVLFNYPAIN